METRATRAPHLDMVRGIAALAVSVGHLRSFFVVDYQQVPHTVAAKAFYLATGFHQQAVLIFFVLSGFLVGGSVIKARRQQRWSWVDYLTRRLCRLWIVIIPALLLTLFWDTLGAHGGGAPGYSCRWLSLISSGPCAASWPYDLSPRALLGNIAFLQTITVAPFGSNAPIWSLANEFWYYLLFPLGLQALLRNGTLTSRFFAASIIAGICILLPGKMLFYGVIWLFGVAAFVALDHATTARIASRWPLGLASLITLGAALVSSRAQIRVGSDFLIGAAFAAGLPWLASVRSPGLVYQRIGFLLSEMSYTLYLVHFPLMAWIFFTFFAPGQFVLNETGLIAVAGVLAVTMLYAFVVWWMFERNTDRMRAVVAELLRSASITLKKRKAEIPQ